MNWREKFYNDWHYDNSYKKYKSYQPKTELPPGTQVFCMSMDRQFDEYLHRGSGKGSKIEELRYKADCSLELISRLKSFFKDGVWRNKDVYPWYSWSLKQSHWWIDRHVDVVRYWSDKLNVCFGDAKFLLCFVPELEEHFYRLKRDFALFLHGFLDYDIAKDKFKKHFNAEFEEYWNSRNDYVRYQLLWRTYLESDFIREWIQTLETPPFLKDYLAENKLFPIRTCEQLIDLLCEDTELLAKELYEFIERYKKMRGL